MSGSQFSAEVPKGDGWGLEDAVQEAVDKIMAGEKSPLIPVVGVIDIKTVKIDPETHNLIAVVRVRRLEALTKLATIREAQRMLLAQWAERRGEGAVLPFEEKEFFDRAFGGIDVAEIEQDERETAEDAGLDDPERLRRHLTSELHGYEVDAVNEMEWADVTRLHERTHTDGTNDLVPHDEESWVWRRVDVKDLTDVAYAEGDDHDGGEGAAGVTAPELIFSPIEDDEDRDEDSEGP